MDELDAGTNPGRFSANCDAVIQRSGLTLEFDGCKASVRRLSRLIDAKVDREGTGKRALQVCDRMPSRRGPSLGESEGIGVAFWHSAAYAAVSWSLPFRKGGVLGVSNAPPTRPSTHAGRASSSTILSAVDVRDF